MKVNKTQAILFMYDVLLQKGTLNKIDIISELEITNLTFLRYIQELRAYFCNFANEYELIYSKEKDHYFLVREVL